MNVAHVHLMLNHFPVLGTLIGLVLFLFALKTRQDKMVLLSFGIFLVMALIAVPVYMSGFFAQNLVLDNDPNLSEAWILRHQDWALLSFILIGATGVFSWLGLWQSRQSLRPERWTVAVVVTLSLVTTGVLAKTATTGGEIHHAEIRAAELATPTDESAQPKNWTATIGEYVQVHRWVWPTLETVHFVGMALIIGVALAVNLRVLGMGRSIPFAALHQLLPLGLAGFLINLISGSLFVISAAEQYANNIALQVKLLLIMIAGINVLYFTVADDTWRLDRGDDAPLSGKLIAGFTIAVWFGVMCLGRLMPYLSFNLDL